MIDVKLYLVLATLNLGGPRKLRLWAKRGCLDGGYDRYEAYFTGDKSRS